MLPDGLHVQYLSDVAAPLEWLAADAPEMRQAQELGRFMANYDGPVARRVAPSKRMSSAWPSAVTSG